MKNWFSIPLLGLFLMILFPWNMLHQHDLKECHKLELQEVHACHLSIQYPGMGIKGSCEHSAHFSATENQCKLCHFHFFSSWTPNATILQKTISSVWDQYYFQSFQLFNNDSESPNGRAPPVLI